MAEKFKKGGDYSAQVTEVLANIEDVTGSGAVYHGIYDGKLFLRANNHLMCYDMKKKS